MVKGGSGIRIGAIFFISVSLFCEMNFLGEENITNSLVDKTSRQRGAIEIVTNKAKNWIPRGRLIGRIRKTNSVFVHYINFIKNEGFW